MECGFGWQINKRFEKNEKAGNDNYLPVSQKTLYQY
jgi:hypothetical protein